MKKVLLSMAALMVCAVSVMADDCPTPGTATATVTLKRCVSVTGAFTVASGKQVTFATGNLQYKATGTGTVNDPKWRFAENQYDYVGKAAGNTSPSSSQSNWIDLFGWATSGITSPKGNTYANPWNTSNAGNTEYAKYGSGITTANVNWSDNSNAFANYDWGKNTIYNNGALDVAAWRTLTNAEWGYLFNTRDNAANLRTLATVCNVPGMLILPDGWTASDVSLSITTADYTTNNLDATAWESLECDGAVFLPAAGFRFGMTVNNAGSNGFYWSSTSYSSTSAYYLYFSAGYLHPQEYHVRCRGVSVRLVQDL